MGLKILLRNIFNILKKKKMQLMAIGLVMGLSSLIYTTMFYTLDSMKVSFEKFKTDYNQEDFSIEIIDGITTSDIKGLNDEEIKSINNMFTYSLMDIKDINEDLYNKIIKNRINNFEKAYSDLQLELRVYKNVDFNNNGVGNKFIFVNDANNINISYIEEGDKPQNDNEIAVSKIYANKNNLNIGDKISINEKNYVICGYVLFPDITLAINKNDFIIDNSKITPALVSDSEFENIKSKEEIYLSGVVKKEYNKQYDEIMDNFYEKVVDTFSKNEDLDFVTNIVSTENQMRSGTIYEELKSGQQITVILSIIMSSISILIVLILIYKVIKGERNQIGLLKAIGYSNKEILYPYLIILLIISLPMLIIGYIGGIFLSKPMKNLYLDFYLIPNDYINLNLKSVLITVVIPILVILILSYITIRKMLYKKSVELLRISETNEIGILNKISNKLLKDCTIKTKFKFSFILNNTSKFIVFFIGIFLSSMIIIMSLMMVGFFEKMTTDYYKDINYIYEGYVDFTKGLPTLSDNQEPFITVENIKYEDNTANIKGLLAENKLHKLFDEKYNDITQNLNNGVIVNSSFSKMYNISQGDIIKIEINNQTLSRKVAGISKDYGNATIYWRLEDLEKIITYKKSLNLGINETSFNGVYSKSKLNESNYISIINKNDIIDQSKLMQKYIEISVYAMIGFGMLISIIILYILTTLTVEDNYYNISLLKVMGYSNKEVNSMILTSYLVYCIISYYISAYITVLGFDYITSYIGEKFGIVMPFEFNIGRLILGLIITTAIFLLGTYASKKKINRVSLQETLKEYRG